MGLNDVCVRLWLKSNVLAASASRPRHFPSNMDRDFVMKLFWWLIAHHQRTSLDFLAGRKSRDCSGVPTGEKLQ